MSEGVKGIVVEGREVGGGVGEVAREAAEDAGFGGKADFVHAAGGEPGTKPCLEDAGSNVGFGASKDKGGLLEEAAGGGGEIDTRPVVAKPAGEGGFPVGGVATGDKVVVEGGLDFDVGVGEGALGSEVGGGKVGTGVVASSGGCEVGGKGRGVPEGGPEDVIQGVFTEAGDGDVLGVEVAEELEEGAPEVGGAERCANAGGEEQGGS